MEQRELVSGFSDLKELLIRTYKIDRPRELVKLYFTEKHGALLMHDYDDHKKEIALAEGFQMRRLNPKLTLRANALVIEALQNENPEKFLNLEFDLNGFFRS